jgi:acyl-ACP thioesterase
MRPRTFANETIVRLADVDCDARLRLSALGRYLQDVAHDDMEDSGLVGAGTWVLRRVEIDVTAVPRFDERVLLETTTTGVGPRWAERVTTLTGASGSRVDAYAVWVFVDGRTGRPKPLPDAFHERFPVADDKRRVSIKLRHPAPPARASSRPWVLRASDFDVMGHMNNAAYWEPVDDVLSTLGRPLVRRAELEYRAAIAPADDLAVSVHAGDGERPLGVWLATGGELRASAQVWCGAGR